jgi:hypothetical protein
VILELIKPAEVLEDDLCGFLGCSYFFDRKDIVKASVFQRGYLRLRKKFTCLGRL